MGLPSSPLHQSQGVFETWRYWVFLSSSSVCDQGKVLMHAKGAHALMFRWSLCRVPLFSGTGPQVVLHHPMPG